MPCRPRGSSPCTGKGALPPFQALISPPAVTLALPVPAQVEPESLLALLPLRLTAGLILGTEQGTVREGEWEMSLSPFLATMQTLRQVLACALCVWVTVEGKETSEESGILGSNPSSEVCFLDGSGEL